MTWREHVWSKPKYRDAATPSGCRCRRCGVSYDDLMAKPYALRFGGEWRCRFRFSLRPKKSRPRSRR